MTEHVIRWCIFSVVVALLPLLLNFVRNVGRGKKLGFVDMFSHGELLLISAAITAAALGQLFASENTHRIPEIVVGGSGVIVLVVASYWFADVSGQEDETRCIDEKVIAIGSIVVFACALLASLGCVYLGRIQGR